MKTTHGNRQSEKDAHGAQRHPAAGARGVSVTPPTYGIALADAGPPIQRKCERCELDPVQHAQDPSASARTGGPRSAQAQGARSLLNTAQAIAREGIRGRGSSMPFLAAIQRSFGRHDMSHVRAHVGGSAVTANQAMGSIAYATGHHIAFRGAPDLHTTAHEAAHVVQQASGVAVPGGVGRAGDRHERHADAVADRVVRGESAEALLDAAGTGGGARGAGEGVVQRQASAGGFTFAPSGTTTRGELGDDGSSYVGLADSTRGIVMLPDTYVPRFLNAEKCGGDKSCLSGWGQCVQKYTSTDVLNTPKVATKLNGVLTGKLSNPKILNKTFTTSEVHDICRDSMYNVQVPSSSDCRVLTGSALHNFVRRRDTEPSGKNPPGI